MADESSVTNHYALLVGVDSYTEKPLKGCVRDVREIEQYLRQAIRPLDIQVLVAPEYTDLDTSRLLNDTEIRPTKRKVTAAISKIINAAKAGDYVYIHFSGHGMKTPPDSDFSNQLTGDLALALLDEEDGKPARPLSGPQLAEFYLDPMVSRGVIVTLVLDCCFSASVYRQDDPTIRFLPNETTSVLLREHSPELEESHEVGTISHLTRDASMRSNWLMNPDGYAILAACGAGQQSGEIINAADGASYGKLSYFLRRSFRTPGGCRKTHAAIYGHLRAAFQGRQYAERPVLYGNKNQSFFGELDTEGCQSFQAVYDTAGELRLLAGRAHGLCKGDRFVLSPVTYDSTPSPKRVVVNANIVQLGGLTSILETTDKTTYGRHSIWTASVLTQSSLGKYPIHLHHDLPERSQLQAALAERFLAVEENEFSSNAVHVTSGQDQDLEIRTVQGRLLSHATYSEAAERIEHLVRFAMVRDLANTDSDGTFQSRFNVYINSGGNRFDSDLTIAVRHGEMVELCLENCGLTPLFFSLYDMSPSWEVCNMLGGSYVEIAAPDSTQTPAQLSYDIEMSGSSVMREKGLLVSDDYIKVFVTSHPSLFDPLELPELGQAVAEDDREHPDVLRLDPALEQSEQWASVTFHIAVSM